MCIVLRFSSLLFSEHTTYQLFILKENESKNKSLTFLYLVILFLTLDFKLFALFNIIINHWN